MHHRLPGKVGIKAKRRHIEDVGTWTKSGQEGKMEGIQYYSWGSNSISMPTPSSTLDVFQGAIELHNDAALDQLLDEGRTQLDTKKRLEAYAKAQKLIHEKAYWIRDQHPVHDRGREQEPELRGQQRRNDADLSRLVEELKGRPRREAEAETESPLRLCRDIL